MDYIIGIVFGWVVLGLLLTPFFVLLELCVDKAISYATYESVDLSRFKVFTKATIWREDDGDFSPFGALILMTVAAISLAGGAWVEYSLRGEYDTYLDSLIYNFYGIWVEVGMYLAYLLLLVAAVAGGVYLIRKLFKFKADVEAKLGKQEK